MTKRDGSTEGDARDEREGGARGDDRAEMNVPGEIFPYLFSQKKRTENTMWAKKGPVGGAWTQVPNSRHKLKTVFFLGHVHKVNQCLAVVRLWTERTDDDDEMMGF